MDSVITHVTPVNVVDTTLNVGFGVVELMTAILNCRVEIFAGVCVAAGFK